MNEFIGRYDNGLPYGSLLVSCASGTAPVWTVILPTKREKLKQYLTKVKQMFFGKKDKEMMKNQIKGLQETDSALRKVCHDNYNEIKDLKQKIFDLSEALVVEKNTSSAIRLVLSNIAEWRGIYSTERPNVMQDNGFRFIGNYGKDNGFQMWIKDKKQPSKTKKSKSKKKR